MATTLGYIVIAVFFASFIVAVLTLIAAIGNADLLVSYVIVVTTVLLVTVISIGAFLAHPEEYGYRAIGLEKEVNNESR